MDDEQDIPKRKGIPKRTRFEVFKRDSFTCQYCGKKAPDVILEIDHIDPVAHGGDGDIMNLITACEDCNAGKSDKLLSDNAIVEKQREQVAKLQERREQIDMMLEWRESLLSINDYETDRIIEFINNRIKPLTLTESCREKIREYKNKWGVVNLISAIEISANTYLKIDTNGVIKESAEKMLEKIPGICYNTAKYEKDPGAKDIDEIRFRILGHGYVNVRVFYPLCKRARQVGISTKELMSLSENVKSWTDWRVRIESLVESLENRNV